MSKKMLFSVQDMAKEEGVCIATMYKRVQAAGYSMDKGRAANLFTFAQKKEINSFKATRGRPRLDIQIVKPAKKASKPTSKQIEAKEPEAVQA